MRRSKRREKKSNRRLSNLSEDSHESNDELDPQGIILWQDVEVALNKEKVLCDLKVDIMEHIVASLLFWNRKTTSDWSCVQVIDVETITEEKRILLLEVVNSVKEYDVVYFVSHELVDKYFVEQFDLTKQSKSKLAKVKLVGAKLRK